MTHSNSQLSSPAGMSRGRLGPPRRVRKQGRSEGSQHWFLGWLLDLPKRHKRRGQRPVVTRRRDVAGTGETLPILARRSCLTTRREVRRGRRGWLSSNHFAGLLPCSI